MSDTAKKEAAPANKKDDGPPRKKVELKPLLRARFRCEEDHDGDPWLKWLYVIFRPVDPTPAPEPKAGGDKPPPAPPPPPVKPFQLGVTDKEGYLSPLDGDTKAHALTAGLLVEGGHYEMYLVRHPAADLPRQILAHRNKELADLAKKPAGDKSAPPKKKWGEPLTTLEVKREETGKSKGKKVEELVVHVPEKADNYRPLGHEELYGKWVLFRGMPNDSCCQEQVKRLQYHLGALRYWVGYHGAPYRPVAPGSKALKEYINEGIFETITWNAVLAFQRDAKAGSAKKVGPDVIALLLDGYEPTAAAQSNKQQRTHAPKFVVDTDATADEAKFADIPYETVVDKRTGDAIKAWIDKGLRKPNAVLITAGDDSTWMNARAQASFLAWSAKLKEYGFKQGIDVSNCLRDPRIGIQTGHGQVATSIHKSGFALDLTMAWGKPSTAYPLQYELDLSKKPEKRWIVYARVPEKAIPKDKVEPVYAKDDTKKEKPIGYKGKTETYIEYVDSVKQFVYDPRSETGGATGPALKVEGVYFLNLTKIAHAFGYARIGPHQRGWQIAATKGKYTISGAGEYRDIVVRLGLHVKQVKGEKHGVAVEESFKLDGEEVDFTDVDHAVSVLDNWVKIARSHGPSPSVHVDPASKSGASLLQSLRAHEKTFKNVTFLLTQDPPPKPKGQAAAGQKPIDTAAPAKDPPAPKTEEISIHAKTKFPSTPFTLVPKTSPELKHGAVVELPDLLGDPAHMEWWHFQWVQGYKGKTWKGILGDIGWTEEGLLGKPSIYGQGGVGYVADDLSHAEKVGIDN
jgi:hypothetical protein